MGAADAGGQKYNYENINNMMGDSLTSDGTTTSFNFEKSGDYALRQAGGGGQGTYEFNGNKTFKTNNGTSTNYLGTNQEGSQGGSLVAKVYGADAANRILKYHQNMNLLNSGEIYI
mgnify:CR=1 FL=1